MEHGASSLSSRHTPCAVAPHTACTDYIARSATDSCLTVEARKDSRPAAGAYIAARPAAGMSAVGPGSATAEASDISAAPTGQAARTSAAAYKHCSAAHTPVQAAHTRAPAARTQAPADSTPAEAGNSTAADNNKDRAPRTHDQDTDNNTGADGDRPAFQSRCRRSPRHPRPGRMQWPRAQRQRR